MMSIHKTKWSKRNNIKQINVYKTALKYFRIVDNQKLE